jgi:hypothetical protein
MVVTRVIRENSLITSLAIIVQYVETMMYVMDVNGLQE